MNSVSNKIVSVIISTYNVENYVKQCLDSILNQTYSYLEVIVVDDSSRDNTVSAVKEIIKNDNRVKLIELDKHVGVSEIRNIGLDNVTGKYLYFLDADDFIDLNYIESMVKAIEEDNVNLVSNHNIIKYGWKKNNEQFWWNKKLKNGVLEINSRNMYDLPSTLWCNLYKTSFIKKNNIKFFEKDLSFEDFYFNSIVFSYMDKVSVIDKPSYYYRFREDSTTGSNNEKESRFDIIEVMEFLYNYFKEHDLLDKVQLNFLELKIRLHKHKHKTKYYKKIRLLFLDINDGIVCKTDSWATDNIKFFNDVLRYKNYLSYKLFNHEYRALFDLKLFGLISLFKIKEYSDKNTSIKKKFYIFSIPLLKIIRKDKKTYIKLFGFIPLLKIKRNY